MAGTLKEHTLALMQRVGVTSRVAASGWRRRRLLILCYHGIARFDEHLWNPALYISANVFARRMELLRVNRCSVLALGDAVERLYRDDLPERAVALTFDDGYYDFGAAAHPVLKSQGLPSTVYLTTLRCEHNMPIVGLMLSYVLWQRRDRVLDGRGIPGLGDAAYRLNDEKERDRIVSGVNSALARLQYTKTAKDELVRSIAERLDVAFDDLLARRVLTLLNPSEVASLAGQGVDFQLHTHRHRSPNDGPLLVREIRDNRERIEAMTGRPAIHFCWPSGVYWREQLDTLSAEGVTTATTCDPALATRATHPLLLPRFVDTSMIDETTFTSWLNGPAAWMSHRSAAAMAAARSA